MTMQALLEFKVLLSATEATDDADAVAALDDIGNTLAYLHGPKKTDPQRQEVVSSLLRRAVEWAFADESGGRGMLLDSGLTPLIEDR